MLHTGRRIHHYELLRQLGKGGMGEVWLAYDISLDRQVAIKFLADNVQSAPGVRERFLREAKAAAALDHPFICKIYETGEVEGQAFIVMEYVEGRNLADKLKDTKLSAREALQTALEVAEALEIAHAKGIVHRDLKPANIMFTTQGHAKIMDFGIAKRILAGPESTQATLTQAAATQEGSVIGTIDYMSPEQAKGAAVDGRSDIFSLGIILYEMLSKKHPFAKPTPVETLSSMFKDAPPPFSVSPKNANPTIQHILKKCLAKNPTDRYPKVAELEADLHKVRDEMAGGLPYFLKGWRGAAAVAAAVAVIGFVVWRFAASPKVQAPKPAPEPTTVLVVDFTNSTGDKSFDLALEPSLIRGLEQAPFINIYGRDDARTKAGQLVPNAKGRLDANLGQLVCRSEGIPILVDGSIENAGPGAYKLKSWAVDPVAMTQVASAEETIKNKNEVVKAAARLSIPIAEKVGGGKIEGAKTLAVETFTTSSLEAMNAYIRAQNLMKQGNRADAIREYERAIQEDPDFGRAYSGLAVVYSNAGEAKKAEEYHQKALERLDSMNEREKFRTRGIWYLMTKNHPKAVEEFSALIAKYPADSAGQSNLAYAYFQARDTAQAVAQGRRYVGFFPKNINGQYNLSWYALGAGDFALALNQVRKTLELNPKFEKVHVTAALTELAQGRPAEAQTWYQKLAAISYLGSSFAAIGQADLALYEGRAADAANGLERNIEADIKNNKPDMAAEKCVALGEAKLLKGDKAGAIAAADKAAGLIRTANILYPAAEICLRAGQAAKALGFMREMAGRYEPEPRACAKILEGDIARRKGDAVGAIELYREAGKLLDTWLGRLRLAEAYLETKAYAEAHSELDLCFKRRGEAASLFLNDVPTYRYFPAYYYLLGRVREGLKSPQAKESYELFLTIKAKDEGDPLVLDARKRAALIRQAP